MFLELLMELMMNALLSYIVYSLVNIFFAVAGRSQHHQC